MTGYPILVLCFDCLCSIVAGAWTGIAFSNLKIFWTRNRIKNFGTGPVSESEKVTPATSIRLNGTSVANLAVFQRIWAWVFVELQFFEDLRVACLNCKLLVFWACHLQISVFRIAFFKFCGTFAFFNVLQKAYWACLFLWKFAHFGLVFSDFLPCLLFNFLAFRFVEFPDNVCWALFGEITYYLLVFQICLFVFAK